MTFANFLLILILIALNGFFVSVEFAAVASRRARLDLLPQANSRAGQLVRAWLEERTARDRMIAAAQLGITVVSLALGAVGENTFASLLEPVFADAHMPPWLNFLEFILPALPLTLSLIVVTALHVVLGEQVPKVAVLRGPERFALAAAPVMDGFSRVFKGFISLLDGATRLVLEMVGLPRGDSHSSVYSLEEFKQIVSGPDLPATIEQPEREMLSAVIDFGALVVRQVSISRTEIVAVEGDAPLDEVIQAALEHGLTKIPVYENDIDHITGIVHLRDLVLAWRGSEAHKTARDLAREALFVPETSSVNDLLVQFRARHTHIAIVLDEFGGTYGLVTLEDLLEEIIGEIQDPFDATPPPIQPLADGTALIDGRTFIEEINEHFALNLVEAFYDTIAGYMLSNLGRIPQMGDIVEDADNRIRLRVEAMDRLRVAQVRLERM